MDTTTRSLLLLICITFSAVPAAAMQALQAGPPAPSEAVQALQGVDVARDTLDSYAGRYVISPGFEVRVWREDQRLMLQVTGQDAWPLVAESESVFVVPAMDARVSFGRDAQGQADHLVVHVDGRQTHALRR